MARQYKNELTESVDTPMSMSSRLLFQFTNADVSPYTTTYSRIAHTKFRVSTAGERTFNHSLTNLPIFVAADDNLQFGWNEHSIWRNLELHKYEYEHLLLHAALAECLPEDYVAAVLGSLADDIEEGDRLKPSLKSWRGMVRSLNGMLAFSDFPLMIDDHMRLDPYRVTSGHSTSCSNAMVSPTEFANALRALGKLSLAETGELTLVGGNFLGWFSAFAELFLGLNVQITSRDGHTLHATTHNPSKALLRLIFMDDIENLTATLNSQSPDTYALTVMCSPDQEARKIPRVPFTGRVAWDGVLPKVFESAFHRMVHQDSKPFVQSIGGMCRYYRDLAENPNTTEDVLSSSNKVNKASYGEGLINTLCNWFPELRHLQGRLEKLQNLPYEEFRSKCDEGAKGHYRLCGCTICTLVPVHGDHDTGRLPQSFCLLAMMETILNLGLALSRITVIGKIYPSRAGVLCMYQRQVQKLLYAKENLFKLRSHERIKVLYGNDYNASVSQRLQNVAAIFSGSWPQDNLPGNLVALSHEGVNAYVLDVQHSDNGGRGSKRSDVGVIRVGVGHIAWKQKCYARATRGMPENVGERGLYMWERAKCRHLSEELYFK